MKKILLKNWRKGEENWRKGNPCYVVAESLAILLPAVIWKVGNIPGGCVTWLRFPSRVLLNMWPDFFLLLKVKCEQKEISRRQVS